MMFDTHQHSTQVLGAFELADAAPGLEYHEFTESRPTWRAAIVPGGAHESLVRAGEIDHPYAGRNEDSIGWVEERDWWYRTTFEGPADLSADERLDLVFHGLDTVAEAWLNGERLGSHENMFRPATFDITTRVRAANTLVLRFSPPLSGLSPDPVAVSELEDLGAILAAMGEGDGDASSLSPALTTAVNRRKALFSWGWDFGPRVPSIGIWRPAEVRRTTRARVSGHHVRTDAVDPAAHTADVGVTVEIDALVDTDLTAQVTLTSPTGRAHEASAPVREGLATLSLRVDDAALWWTHDLGDPALYEVEVTLTEGERVLDSVHDRVGLRTIEVDRTPQPEGGRLFQFVLNGVPTFARGANWLPASMFVGSVTPEHHRRLVELARDGGMTMLRVWGGGIYELDSFYRATDECGVLVWQDFMFACIDYPSQDPGLQREVTLEAEYQVRRLRNRASMALWCGNNEAQLLHGLTYQNYEPGNWGWDFYHRILPDTVAALDPTATYWPGSPWGEDTPEGFMAVNGTLDGDRHAWEVWHGYDVGVGVEEEYESVGDARHFRRYANDNGRFISEFGIHAAPARATLERWIEPSQLGLHSPTLDAHNKDHPKDKGDALLEAVTGAPRDLDEYIDFTMAAQAEGLKFGIEHYRRRQPQCAGTLVWQFNDVWPGLSWSIVDHDLVPKAGYYAAKRAFAPVLASFHHADGLLSLWVSNSGALDVSGTARVTLLRIGGDTLAQEDIAFTAPAGSSGLVWSRALDPASDVVAWVESPEEAFPSNRLFLAEVKDLPLPRVPLRSEVRTTDATSARVWIAADAYTYQVRVESPHASARFDDNFFDMRPGDERLVTVTGLPEGFDPAGVVVGSYAGAGTRVAP